MPLPVPVEYPRASARQRRNRGDACRVGKVSRVGMVCRVGMMCGLSPGTHLRSTTDRADGHEPGAPARGGSTPCSLSVPPCLSTQGPQCPSTQVPPCLSTQVFPACGHSTLSHCSAHSTGRSERQPLTRTHADAAAHARAPLMCHAQVGLGESERDAALIAPRELDPAPSVRYSRRRRGPVPAQMWAGPGADVGRSRRRCGPPNADRGTLILSVVRAARRSKPVLTVRVLQGTPACSRVQVCRRCGACPHCKGTLRYSSVL